MAARTLTQRYAAALERRGCERIRDAYGTKWLRTAAHEGVPATYYYLGSHGSLRFGRNRATSRPVSDKFKDNLLA